MRVFMMHLLRIIAFVITMLVQGSQGSHFRGAMIYWKKSSTKDNVINIDYRQAWRRTSLSPICNDTVKTEGILMSNGDLTVTDNLLRFYSMATIPFDFQCTDYSIVEDWTSGKGSSNFSSVSVANSSIFFVTFQSCCWIASINDMYDTNWSLMMMVNTSIRNDIGRVNQSPRVDMPPLIRLQYGCNHTIRIPVSDADRDDIRCRWAESYYQYDECGGACRTFPNAAIDERACTITYDARYNLGWYAVTVQIEDFSSKSSDVVLSSIPLQFLVSVENNTGNCSSYMKEKPKFIGLTLPDKACIGIENSTDFTTDIFIEGTSNTSISELTTISPIGLVKSSLQQINATGLWHVNVKWNPSGTDSVNNVFCFSAVDNKGLTSDQRCVTLLAGVPPPVVLPSSRQPSTSPIPSNQQEWSLEFDQFANKPDKPAYVYLYKTNGVLVESVDVSSANGVTYTNGVHGTVLKFRTTSSLQPGEDYYFQLGRGLVHGKSYCGAESAAVTDPYYWRFTVESRSVQQVDVRCERNAVVVPCTESDLNCTVSWNFANPCIKANVLAGEMRFPYPVYGDRFLQCDSTGKVFIVYCPPGENNWLQTKLNPIEWTIKSTNEKWISTTELTTHHCNSIVRVPNCFDRNGVPYVAIHVGL